MCQKNLYQIDLILAGCVIFLLAMPFLATPCEAWGEPVVPTEPYRILCVIDDEWGGFDYVIMNEFVEFGWDVTLTAGNKTVIGSVFTSYMPLDVDITLDNISSIYMYDCILILPGADYPNLLYNTEFHILLQKAVARGIIVCAWNRAVRVLARADVIDGRNVTGNLDFQSEYEAAGANFIPNSPPIADGNIITSLVGQFELVKCCDLVQTSVENNKPELLDFSTYLGGSNDEGFLSSDLDHLGDCVVDSDRNIIVVGRTNSDDFPSLNPYQDIRNGGFDATISKFSPNGTLIFSTYFGGDDDDWATSVDIDSNNNIIFTGMTKSSNLPLQNPYQMMNKGGTIENTDSFFAKISENGQTLLLSSYFGGTDDEWGCDISIDKEDRIWVVDTAPEVVKIYNPEGRLLLFFGLPGNKGGMMNMPAKVIVDYDNVDLFQEYAVKGADLEFLVLVSNQFGPNKISVYGFGSFPEQQSAETE